MAQPGDIISLVEQAYRLDLDDSAWLNAVTHAAEPMLQRGMGVFAFYYETMSERAWRVGQVVNLGAPEAVATVLRNVAPMSPPEMTRRFYWAVPCTSVLELLGDSQETEFLRAIMHPHGAKDVLMVKAADPTGASVGLCAPMKQRAPTGTSTALLWSKLSAHLASAYRLRQHLQLPAATSNDHSPASRWDDAEAILSASGAVEHALEPACTPSAQDALRRAAVRMDRARSELRRSDGAAALELWQGLIEGRWSMVDQFDSDGRRYFVARRNDPRTPDPRRLTQRERQIVHLVALGHANKLIAYELGLSPTTVAIHLSGAMRKLGVKHRAQLIERVRHFERLAAQSSAGEN